MDKVKPTKRKYAVLRLDAQRCGWNEHEDDDGGFTSFVEIEATSPQDAVRRAFRDADPAIWECEPPVGGLWRADVRDPLTGFRGIGNVSVSEANETTDKRIA